MLPHHRGLNSAGAGIEQIHSRLSERQAVPWSTGSRLSHAAITTHHSRRHTSVTLRRIPVSKWRSQGKIHCRSFPAVISPTVTPVFPTGPFRRMPLDVAPIIGSPVKGCAAATHQFIGGLSHPPCLWLPMPFRRIRTCISSLPSPLQL